MRFCVATLVLAALAFSGPAGAGKGEGEARAEKHRAAVAQADRRQELRDTSTDLSIMRLEWRHGSEALERRRMERSFLGGKLW